MCAKAVVYFRPWYISTQTRCCLIFHLILIGQSHRTYNDHIATLNLNIQVISSNNYHGTKEVLRSRQCSSRSSR